MCQLADQYEALIFLDECHATGFFGPTGRGTEEFSGLKNKVNIINSTLGKALGGAAGVYVVFLLHNNYMLITCYNVYTETFLLMIKFCNQALGR